MAKLFFVEIFEIFCEDGFSFEAMGYFDFAFTEFRRIFYCVAGFGFDDCVKKLHWDFLGFWDF